MLTVTIVLIMVLSYGVTYFSVKELTRLRVKEIQNTTQDRAWRILQND